MSYLDQLMGGGAGGGLLLDRDFYNDRPYFPEPSWLEKLFMDDGEENYFGLNYAKAPDMSAFAGLDSLLRYMPQQQSHPRIQAQGYMHPYLGGLLSG